MTELVEKQIAALRGDDVFMAYIDTPLIQQAVEHWLNIHRLPADVAEEKFGNNYMVQSVFDRIKNLQQLCASSGVQFPLELIHLPSRNKPATTTTTAGGGEKRGQEDLTSAAAVHTPPRVGVLKQPSTHTRKRLAKGESASIKFDANIVREFSIPSNSNKGQGREHWLSVTDPRNIARWWATQCLCLLLAWILYYWT
ncbi:hypothetical protein BASA81_006737 [Batrachochytrium salamandrivorans]|nr:hypothetical protein BASA81_006737 [Batrachochytrium salamandrivorans]